MASVDTSVENYAMEIKTEDPKAVTQESGTPAVTTPRSVGSDEYMHAEVSGAMLQARLRTLINHMG